MRGEIVNRWAYGVRVGIGGGVKRKKENDGWTFLVVYGICGQGSGFEDSGRMVSMGRKREKRMQHRPRTVTLGRLLENEGQNKRIGLRQFEERTVTTVEATIRFL